MDRPSPVAGSPPVGTAESRWKRPNIRRLSSSLRPGPRSFTSTRARPPRARAATSMREESGEYLIALPTRLSTISRR